MQKNNEKCNFGAGILKLTYSIEQTYAGINFVNNERVFFAFLH